MKKILLAAALAGLVAAAPGGSGGAPDLVHPVGVLEFSPVGTPNTFEGHGSGVFISPTKFLTAGHVFEAFKGDSVGRVRLEDGDIYGVVKTEKADGVDVGYVTVDRPYKGYIPPISCEKQKRGTELTVVGNPLNLEFMETKIVVAGGRPKPVVEQNAGLDVTPQVQKKFKRQFPKEPDKNVQKEEPVSLAGVVLFQGVALPGLSGSPVYTPDGKIVGVLTISVVYQGTSFTGLGAYVGNDAVCKFLQDAANDVVPPPADHS